MGRLRIQAAAKPDILHATGADTGDLVEAVANLEATYVVRLYAQFEGTLRGFWTAKRGMHRKSEPPARQLLEAIGAHRQVDPDTLLSAHRVREYRNDLAHFGSTRDVMPITTCRAALCHFISYLPLEW